MEDSNKSRVFDSLSLVGVFILGFLIPIFFLPLQGISVDAGKGIFVAILGLVSFMLWLIGRLIGGSFSLPRSLILLGAAILTLAVLISSFFSESSDVSFMGQGFETGTFAFSAVALVLLFLSSVLFQPKRRALYFYGAILLSSLLVAIFHIVRLASGVDTLSFGIFGNQTSNLVGKWNDLSIFFGLTLLLSLTTIELLSMGRIIKLMLFAAVILSLFFVALVNFTLTWAMLFVAALVLVIYGIYFNRQDTASPAISVRKVKLPVASVLVAVISLFFVLFPATLGSYLSTRLNITQVEVRPSLSATFDIAKETLKKHPILGSGPNRFTSEWLSYKPEGINNTFFWNTDFNTGFSAVTTSLVTGGAAGFLAWILFLAIFLYVGFNAMFNFSLNRVSRYLIVSSFILGAYLWAFILLYFPNITIYVLALLVTGILVATLTEEKIVKRYNITLLGEPKLGFISVIFLIFLLIASVSLGLLFSQRFLSLVYFQKGLYALNAEANIEKTELYLNKAVKLSNQDIYHRASAELGVIKLNGLFSQPNTSQDALRAQFQLILSSAIRSAKTATDVDKTNYLNFISLGRIYEVIGPLNITGAYESAKDSYSKALSLNPESPSILLSLARLEAARNNSDEARAYITKALAKKPNYTEAVFFLSQLEAQLGNIKEAIKRTEEVSMLAPDDITVFFQLGLLKYNNRDYDGAIAALLRAVSLNSDYSNAKYFLGLSYQKEGRTEGAIKQFEGIELLNPANQEVKNILKNLRAGKDPFTNIAPPDNKPERRKKPPIEE
ncbi:MAG: tetratricopeptide repeat protein [Patescibacteria group bacterium]